ncbi:uncharacterized protein ACJ7VT_010450 [Polymixia lowei]
MDPPLSVSTLQLLVPPLRLMSACMWQVAQNKITKQYRQLEEFVSLVTQGIHEILTDKKKILLTLGLRAKIMFEQFDEEIPYDIQSFLHRIGSFLIAEVSDVETPVTEFIKFSQSVLTNQEERQRFLQEVFLVEFKPDFDATLLSLVCDFLSQLEEQLPVPNFKQVASFFNSTLNLDDCLTSVLPMANIKGLLKHHRCFLTFDVNDKMAETPVHSPSPGRSSEPSHTRCLSSYQCPHCGRDFANQFQLVNHLQIHNVQIHKEGGQFKCSKCGKSFRFSTSLSNHKRTLCRQAAYSCLRCGDSFESFRLKLAHTCSHNYPVQAIEGVKCQEKQTFDCQRCGMSFRSIINFKCHVEKEHKTETMSNQTMQGSIIDVSDFLETSEETASELNTENQRLLLQCSHCPLSFAKDDEFRIHLESHKPLDRYKCRKSFTDLGSHVQKHEAHTVKRRGKSEDPAVSQSSRSKTSDQISLHCGHCTLSFAGFNELQEHRRAHNIEDRTLDCHKCGMSFVDLAALTRHVDEHIHLSKRSDFLCDHCGKIFHSKAYLKQHMVIHTNYRPHCCTYCGKCFHQKGNLTVHVRLHTGEKPFMCPDCGKTFSSRGDLQVHQRFHTGVKPYQCKECNARFFTSSHLQVHMRNHRGERPHACLHCGKRFLRPSCLKNHLLIHSGLRPFSCPHCLKMFKRKSHLTSHVKRSHK